MLIKAFSISLLAAGAGLALSKMAAAMRGRRADVATPATLSASPAAPARAERTPSENLGGAAGVLPPSSLPQVSVLPVAFWDAASERLEEEEPPPPTPRMRGYHPDAYDSIDPEDISLEWLTRATEAPERYDADADDAAEIEVGSSSLVSEASRAAARSAEALEADTQRQPELRWDDAARAEPAKPNKPD